MKADTSLLQAALYGYKSQITEIEKAMSEIRRRLGVAGGAELATVRTGRRSMSAEARKRISDAQKKRWAQYKKDSAA